jgi:hypothetical protein
VRENSSKTDHILDSKKQRPQNDPDSQSYQREGRSESRGVYLLLSILHFSAIPSSSYPPEPTASRSPPPGSAHQLQKFAEPETCILPLP